MPNATIATDSVQKTGLAELSPAAKGSETIPASDRDTSMTIPHIRYTRLRSRLTAVGSEAGSVFRNSHSVMTISVLNIRLPKAKWQ
jgi:hypothetical protein